jgi:hypothetical protein
MKRRHVLVLLPIVVLVLAATKQMTKDTTSSFLGSAESNSQAMIQQGRHIFRFDTFGDEAFWGDQLKLHQTINMLTPRQALDLGLKIDSQALPSAVVQAIQNGTVNLDDPAVTRLLIIKSRSRGGRFFQPKRHPKLGGFDLRSLSLNRR